MSKLISISLMLLLFVTVATAKEITREEAAKVATKAICQRISGFSGAVQSVEATLYDGKKSFYIVSFAPEGWALISADDKSTPLLGYSGIGCFQLQDQPDNMKYWLGNYSKQIDHFSKVKGERHSGWESVDKALTTRAISGKVEPLIQVNWNQGKPYNQFCPSDSKGTAVVGCVAVAMAQAMSVAKYPAKPQGVYTYVSPGYGSISINYDKEEAYNWNTILSGSDGKVAAARLLYQCGVAVKMDYGVSGSGTQSSYIASALARNFGYPTSVTYYSHDGYKGDWEQLILNELNAGRAVCYSGADLKKNYGHCFNLDGYDGSKMFHVNWGWGGANNGMFSIDALRDATMDMDYTAQQGVVIGIRAPSEGPMNINLSAHTVEANKPIGTLVGNVTVESEATSPSYEYALKGEYSIIFHTYLEAPFYVENGKLRTKEVLNLEDGDRTVYIKVTNVTNQKSLEQAFTINVMPTTGLKEDTTDETTVIYEKSTQRIRIVSPDATAYALYTQTGLLIEKGILNLVKESTIVATSLPTGIYIVQLSGRKNLRSWKVMVE